MNGLIQLDQASVYRTQLPNDEIQRSQARITESSNDGNLSLGGTIAQPASVATDGVYIVQSISYTGDTRGNPWYMDLMCGARGAKDLQSSSAIIRAT